MYDIPSLLIEVGDEVSYMKTVLWDCFRDRWIEFRIDRNSIANEIS